METFTPSLDWGNAIIESILWVARAWAISAICILIVLTLIARFTTWGRQFWRVTGDYFKGPESVLVWAWLGVLLLSVMVSVRIDVLLSYQSNDQFEALQTAISGGGAGNEAVRDSGIRGFWTAMVTLAILATVYIARTLLDLYLLQRFILRWRVWLTDRLTGDWLDHRAYYRGRFIDQPIDNPDQRIQHDIDVFTTGIGAQTNTPTIQTSHTLLFGAVNSIVSVVSFAPILWNLSGPLTILGFTLPKALFWMVLLYVFFTTIVAFWIGRPMIRLSFRNEATNAAFRYALVRLRDAAEAVGFYRGERAERRTLVSRFASIVANYRAFIRRGVAFLGWNLSMSQIISPLPTVIQVPRLFDNEISFGDVTQSSSAFLSVHDSLAFFRSVYDSFASYRAAIIRLEGLVDANEKARELTDFDRAAKYGRRGRARRRRGAFTGREAAHRSARCAADPGRLAGDHRSVRQRQDHPAAQPGPTVAVHHRHGALPRRRERDDVPVPAALYAARRSARGHLLSGRGRGYR